MGNLETVILSEVRKRITNIIYKCTYVKSRRMVRMNLLAKQKKDRYRTNLWISRREWGVACIGRLTYIHHYV